jgi:hypothetical protein
MTTYAIVNDKKELVAATTSEEYANKLRDQWNDTVGFCVHTTFVNITSYHNAKNIIVKNGNHPINITHSNGDIETVTGCSKFSSTERTLARLSN